MWATPRSSIRFWMSEGESPSSFVSCRKRMKSSMSPGASPFSNTIAGIPMAASRSMKSSREEVRLKIGTPSNTRVPSEMARASS